MHLRIVILSLAISLLFGCGPVFETQYSFTPPRAESGRTCVFQCENSKLQCEQLAEMKLENCKDRADREYDRCERNKRYRWNSEKGRQECYSNCHCFRSSCSLLTKQCDTRYRSCYQNCGGIVQSETVCVSGCEGE